MLLHFQGLVAFAGGVAAEFAFQRTWRVRPPLPSILEVYLTPSG